MPCPACSLRRVPGVDLHLQHLHRVLSSQALFSYPLSACGLSLSSYGWTDSLLLLHVPSCINVSKGRTLLS